ncbi:hypothetical protein IC582_007245 [Cucumis melo]|nr:uncharacterized protein At5g48480 [Cucumis melo]KAA0063311.1 Lactoylglutathione lyase / glyoxalase I family protein [Cucumis melo var. makuwa]TYK31466.1 Lactoylglutathione lyase / glyoxalase I family protein [Cucumis melo var. makuwa]
MAESDVQNGVVEKPLSFKAFKPQLLLEAPKATDAVDFYKAAFGAEELNRTLHPKRKAEQETPAILSVELRVSDFSLLVSNVFDDSASAEKVAESRVVLFLETEDIEAAVSKAVSAGAVVESKIADSDGPYVGNRVAKLKDPFGFTWLIGTPAKESPVGEV